MDNATFDRLARMLAGGASRRHTVRALIAAALAGTTAADILAARKDRNKKKGNDKDRGNQDRDRNRDNTRGRGAAGAMSAQGKNNNKKKRKKKKKKTPNGGGGNSCAGTPLQPGQTFLGCDFSGRNLRGRNLNSSLFKDVALTDADLCGANLESTSFTDSEAEDANFTDVNFDSSSHDKTSYAGSNFTNASFRVSTFNKVDFSGADFTGADLTGAAFSDVNFAGAIFCRTIQPNGNEDNRDCDICENTCGLCADCDDEECTPPDCCPNPGPGPAGTCVDTNTDPLNCGGCDVACFDNLSNACVDGECVCGNEPECSGGDTCCPGQEGDEASCIDLDNDTENCGVCGRLCQSSTNPCITVECREGACVDVPADDGTTCRRQGQDGVCCAAGSTVTCVVGTVCCSVAQCDAGEACCEGQCIDVQDDTQNCGACDVICGFPTNPCLGRECVNGECQDENLPDGTACEAPNEQSGVCCADGGTSTCNINATCCTNAQCGSGQSCCRGGCINTATNFEECGSCNNACSATTADGCVGGVCVCGSTGAACGPNLTCCNGECVNINTDLDNCGGCDEICAFPQNPCFGAQCAGGDCSSFNLPNGTVCVFGEASGVCCSGSCEFGDQCCPNDPATCDEGQSCCGGLCANTSDNFNRCGSCTEGCDAAKADACVNSTCVCGANPACGETETCCSGLCVNTSTDTANCGGCDDACDPPLNSCNTVLCLEGTCNNFADPDETVCAEGQAVGVCCFEESASICVAGGECCSDDGCDEVFNCCDNQCVDTDSDFDHCGICGNACIAGRANACSEGQCVCGSEFQCAGTETCCNNACVNTQTDPANCGACGDPCDPAKADGCLNGECLCGDEPACTGTETCCSDECVDTETDVENCGGCGDACLANADTCDAGECVCGELGVACPEGDVCCAGACITPGPNVCCIISDCATRPCNVLQGCIENVCEYTRLADGTFCGFGGECQSGVCVGGEE